MTTEQVIEQFEGWRTADPADILDWMVTETTVLKSNRMTVEELIGEFGTETVSHFVNALEALEFDAMALVLNCSPNGLEFGSEETQRVLALLVGYPEFANYVPMFKALGLDTRTPWQRVMGEAPTPVVEMISILRTAMLIEEQKEQLRGWFAGYVTNWFNGRIDAGHTEQQIKAALPTEF